jgi:hypothetical protein
VLWGFGDDGGGNGATLSMAAYAGGNGSIIQAQAPGTTDSPPLEGGYRRMLSTFDNHFILAHIMDHWK